MKVGDLVRWTHPDEMDVGLVTSLWGTWATIHWIREPKHGGMYSIKHRYLEIIK